MIIKQTRVATGGANAAIAHILKADGNETVEVLADNFQAIRDAELFSELNNHKYSVRHVIFSPDKELTCRQLKTLTKLFINEFGAHDHVFSLVKHTKQRSDGSRSPHYHFVFSEASMATGKVMDAFKTMKRNELLCRKAEVLFDHKITTGRHNSYVIATLKDRGEHDIADKLKAAEIDTKPLPKSGFSATQHQRSKRLGVDLPALRQQLKGSSDVHDLIRRLHKICSDTPGMELKTGERRNVVLLTLGDEVIGNVNRLAGTKYSMDEIIGAVAQFVEERRAAVLEELDALLQPFPAPVEDPKQAPAPTKRPVKSRGSYGHTDRSAGSRQPGRIVTNTASKDYATNVLEAWSASM